MALVVNISVQVHNLISTPQITFTLKSLFHKSDFPFRSSIERTFWDSTWKHCNVHVHCLSLESTGQEREKQTKNLEQHHFT